MQDALQRWRSEKTASYLSSAVAASEPDAKRAALFRQMADAADEQAGILAKDLPAVPPFAPFLTGTDARGRPAFVTPRGVVAQLDIVRGLTPTGN